MLTLSQMRNWVPPTLRVSLHRGSKEIDCFVVHSGEGAIELTVEMLRQHKYLLPGDRVVVELLSEYLNLGETHADTVSVTRNR